MTETSDGSAVSGPGFPPGGTSAGTSEEADETALAWHERAVVAFFLSYLVVQVALPLRAAGDDGIHRFSWQMYSVLAPRDVYTASLPGGAPDTVAFQDQAIAPRMEVDWDERLPAHLCGILPDGTTVRRIGPDGQVKASHPCR